jgi:hypothetical protein
MARRTGEFHFGMTAKHFRGADAGRTNGAVAAFLIAVHQTAAIGTTCAPLLQINTMFNLTQI